MKNTKKMYPGCLYLFEGEASSSSCFIQSEEDAKSFLELANLYLRDFIKIHEYNLHKDSWFMIVSIRSREKVLKSYKTKREISKTCDRTKDHTEIWRIISEQIRQFLKQYVTLANKRSGREGSLVKAPYKRSYFTSIEEAKQYINQLRNQAIKRQQTLKKYRGKKKYYKIAKKKIKGHLILCTKWKSYKSEVDKYFRKMNVEITAIMEFGQLIVSKIISKTIQLHI